MNAGEVTLLLRQLVSGREEAADDLLPIVYGELKRMARRYVRSERPHATLNATALVHEAYLRLGLDRIDWQDRAHFFAVAGRAMRRVLVDAAEARRAQKRGGGAAHVTLDEAVAAPGPQLDDWIALDEALCRLEQLDPRQVRVVECHVLAGLSLDETAKVLAVSPATVSRDWTFARAWLNRTLASGVAERG